MTSSAKRKIRSRADGAAGSPRHKDCEPTVGSQASAKSSKSAAQLTKLEQIVERLLQPPGASIAELTALTGWQPHSVRGALAGSLKRKSHTIISDKVDGVRRYRIAARS